MRTYARQAKNRELEVDAAEIPFRAERRLGELLAAIAHLFCTYASLVKCNWSASC